MSEYGEVIHDWTDRWGVRKRSVVLAFCSGSKSGDDDLRGVLSRLSADRLTFWYRRFLSGPLPAERLAAEQEMIRRRLSRRVTDSRGQLLMFDE